MRWIAIAAVGAACSTGLIGCGDSDHPIDLNVGAGSSGSSAAAGSAGHAGAGHSGAGHAPEVDAGSGGAEDAGAPNGGSSGDGAAGAAIAGNAGASASAGSGGALAGAGGASAGAGGALAGAGGASAGAGGASAGAGGASAGAGGALAGVGGALAGAGGALAGAGGALAGAGGALAGAGGALAGAGGAAAGAGGAAAGAGGAAAGAGGAAAGSAPAAPTGVSITAATPNTFTLTSNWTDASDNESGFNVYWSTDDTQPVAPSATVAAGAHEATLTRVLGGQTYRVWVEAVNAIGKSTAVKATASTVTTDLDWRELWIDDAGSIHLALNDTLNFIADGDAQSQLSVYHSETANALGDPTPLTNADYLIWNTLDKNIDITKAHYFLAEAKKPEGAILSLRTLAPAGALTGLTVTPANLSADVSWAAASGAQGYQTFWGTGTFAQASSSVTSAATSATAVGLNPGTAYTIWVRSVGVGIGGNGFWGPLAITSTTTTGTWLGANLAAGKAANALTEVGAASNLTDGNYGSRWESAPHVDPQWVYVDLGADSVANITHVKAVWEAAYAKSFKIQICNAACADAAPNAPDSWLWQDAYMADRTLLGFPYFELLALTSPMPGRYVRMLGLTRAADYGYSMYELEVYSAP